MIIVAFLAVDVVRPAPAVAHSELKSSNPAAGSVNGAAPASVSLVFGGSILSASLTVTDGCGRAVPAQVTVRDRDVRATLPTGGPPPASGAWSVRWRALSEDGHPISGEVPFTVAGKTDCVASASPSASASAAPDNSPNFTATAATEGTDIQDTAVAVSSESGTFPINILLALAIALLGAGAAVLARRRSAPVQTRDKR
ncbi:copper resistance CopC family protein [Micromonospora sp. NPDC048909]|uniref:copper resistance CopC family protein n=1 Tax=Micromonospora sp. NPDC048909 TaxID=3155643 RepID=UPI00340980F8